MDYNLALYTPRTLALLEAVKRGSSGGSDWEWNRRQSTPQNPSSHGLIGGIKSRWAGLRGAVAGAKTGKGIIGKVSGAYHGAKAASQAKGAQLDRESEIKRRQKGMARAAATRAGQEVVSGDIAKTTKARLAARTGRAVSTGRASGFDPAQASRKAKAQLAANITTKPKASFVPTSQQQQAPAQPTPVPSISVAPKQQVSQPPVPPSGGGASPSVPATRRTMPPIPSGHPASPIVGAASQRPQQRTMQHAVPTPIARMRAQSMKKSAGKVTASAQQQLKKRKPGSVYARAVGA